MTTPPPIYMPPPVAASSSEEDYDLEVSEPVDDLDQTKVAPPPPPVAPARPSAAPTFAPPPPSAPPPVPRISDIRSIRPPASTEQKAIVDAAERAITQLRAMLQELEQCGLVPLTRVPDLAWNAKARRHRVTLAVTFSVALGFGMLLAAVAFGHGH